MPLRNVMSYLRRVAGPSSGDPADAELLERFVTARDESAFDALVRRHGPLVYGACRRLLDDSNDADDVFQATFVVLARRAGAIRKRASVGAWLYGVAYRIARRVKAKAERRRAQETQAVTAMSTDPETDRAWHDLRPVLDEELCALPEKYRLPLVLCYLEGKTWDEAARQLGWRRGSMSRRLEKARELLRARLTRRGLDLPAVALAAVLTSSALSAAVPPALHAHTLEAAGTALPSALAPLVQGELQYMALTKLKWALTLVASLGVLTLGVGFWAFRSASVAAPIPAEKKEADIKLPEDPKAAVITFDHLGSRLRRENNDPVMVVRADGTVIVNDPYGLGAGCESKLTPRELQDLLRYVVREKEFFNYDDAKVKAAIAEDAKNKPGVKVSGAWTTVVRVHADGKEHAASQYALDNMAGLHPAVKELGQFRDIEGRLQRVQWTATAGGADAVTAALKLGNERLKKEQPKAPELTLDDFTGAHKAPDGKVVLRFLRTKIDAAKNPQTFVAATIERPAKGDPTVTVRTKLE
jgi:RNA polymerase sigma factor (sigma-70 family)